MLNDCVPPAVFSPVNESQTAQSYGLLYDSPSVINGFALPDTEADKPFKAAAAASKQGQFR